MNHNEDRQTLCESCKVSSICGHSVLRTKLSKGLGQDEKTIPSLPLTSPQLPLFCELVLQRTLRDT